MTGQSLAPSPPAMLEPDERREWWMLLAAAVAASLASAGVRCLVVKGAVADLRGVRPAKVSADLDALVDPRHVEVALAALATWGWREASVMAASDKVAGHALTLVHPGWPITIDLHRRFPGFTEGAGRAFEALWDHREPLSVAGALCDATDRTGTIVVEGLNALRSAASSPRRMREVDDLKRLIAELDGGEAARLRGLVDLSGAAFAMRPLLGDGDNGPGLAPSNADELEWDLRNEGHGTFVSQAVAALSVGRGGSRTRLLRELVWPTTEQLLAAYGMSGASPSEVARLRWRRFRRGTAQVPAALARTARARRRLAREGRRRS